MSTLHVFSAETSINKSVFNKVETQVYSAATAIKKTTDKLYQKKVFLLQYSEYINDIKHKVQQGINTSINHGLYSAVTKITYMSSNFAHNVMMNDDNQDTIAEMLEKYFIDLGYFVDVIFESEKNIAGSTATLTIELSWDPQSYLADQSFVDPLIIKASLSAVEGLASL